MYPKSIFMKPISFILLSLSIIFLISCAKEDDTVQLLVEPVYNNNPENTLLIDITYIKSSDQLTPSAKKFDEQSFIEKLNVQFFHRHDIGFILGEVSSITNDELHNLKDNRNSETSVFLTETESIFKKDRINIYVIKREHIYAISGIGVDQRVLITDEYLNSTTTPHEIGHSLNLFHSHVKTNIMCDHVSNNRTEFSDQQLETLKNRIQEINLNYSI